MNGVRLSEIATALDVRPPGEDAVVNGVAIDSRQVAAGMLFIALVGPNHDAHRYLADVQAAGAAAALVSRPAELDLPQLVVADTRLALGRLAAWWRGRFDLPLVGVTGSNGKTSVKEMVARILGVAGPVLATRGNLNNDIGLPLSLLELEPGQQAAVLEMGANHPGEIGYLSGIARPTVAVVNNAGPAHLEGFGSLEGVAHAKGEIYSGLTEGGVAVINADDPFADYWLGLNDGRRVIRFGLENEAEVSADWRGNHQGSLLHLRTPLGETQVQLSLPGRHNVMNALAATAAAIAAGASLPAVCAGLQAMQPVAGRLQRFPGPLQTTFVDDSYNANPASLQAGIEAMAGRRGPLWLVVGDMLELGGDAEAMHREMGRQARVAGVQRVYALGRLGCELAIGFGPGGRSFDTMEGLIKALGTELQAGVTVLVKGSRRMGMERVITALCGRRRPRQANGG